MSRSNVVDVKGKRDRRVGGAKVVWGKLTKDERLTLEGHSHKLIQLTQGRYGVSRDVAERQVNGFFEKLGK